MRPASLFVLGLLFSHAALGAQEPVKGQPYVRYSTQDGLGRRIAFYLSEAQPGAASLPLVVYIQGSGCSSLFAVRNERIVPAGGHISVHVAAGRRARVLIVEKPGVQFLDQPKEGCREAAEFNREHTLERWTEAVKAAVLATRALPQVAADKVLVIGHSEGGLVACRVAREMPDVVTHVATMAGGGGSQLFDLITLARKGNFFREVSDNPDARATFVVDQWTAIQAEPHSADKFFFGFAYRRWATFLASSPLDELSQAPARIFIAQGTADDAVDPASADVLYAQLLSRGKPVTYDRVEGANHSFGLKDRPQADGWQIEMEKIVRWFLG